MILDGTWKIFYFFAQLAVALRVNKSLTQAKFHTFQGKSPFYIDDDSIKHIERKKQH